jgi:hypothetical protein
MNIKTIKNAVTSRVGLKLLKAKKHSPQIMFVAGTIGVVGTVVLAARATLKVEQVLADHTELKYKMDALIETGSDQYIEDDYKKDLVKLYFRTSYRLVRLYGPSILLGAASIAALTGAHVTLNRRYAGVTAAYAALDKGFREYRDRVLKEVGPEKEREFRYDMEERTIVEETEEGPVTRTVKKVNTNGLPSIYSRIFDENTSTSWNPEPHYNSTFLRAQQSYMNDMLRARGYLFLNEVLTALGMEICKEGQVVGWILDGGNSDNYVDFGIFDKHNQWEALEFINGNERSIILDFNVDGVVYDKI